MPHLSKADTQNGAMVALFPTPEVAAQLAQPGGEPADDLHVTLAYLGPAANVEGEDSLRQAVAEWAAKTAPIGGSISGIGQFTAGPTPVTYASVDAPTLAAARERLLQCLWYSWSSTTREHGFTPHITLAYDERQITVPNLAVEFTEVTLAIGDQRETFPLAGAYAEWIVPIWKADGGQDDEPLLVYGVVLNPGISDSQQDEVSATEIEKAAHEYLITSRKNDVQHTELDAPEVDVVESYVAPHDLVVAGKPVIKGAWVMGVEIRDPQIKADVRESRITGFSIGGSAIRT